MAYKDKKIKNLKALTYYRRKVEKAKEFLGGKCIRCGSLENLEFDHIDPSTKNFTIGKMWSINEKSFWEEINKCELLCKECHIKKSSLEISKINLGSNNGHSKLTEDIVREIKEKLSQGYKIRKLGRDYNISHVNILDIKKEKIWKHVI